MSTRTAFTVIGTVVGAYFGNPALGATIGSMVGGYVDPVKVKGPRLTDAQQQTSQDGVPIPLTFGTVRIQGNIIATGPLVEHKNKDDGKGSGTETTTYTYTRTYAIGICEGPIAGIRRIWKNGKLVYDGRPLQTGESITDRILLMQFLQSHNVYLGDEVQGVDGELEAVLGAGEVPAFRGLAYMVSIDEDVTDTAGAIPTYEFEVISKGTQYSETEYVPSGYIGKLPFGLNPEARANPLVLGGNYLYAPDWGGGDLDYSYPDFGSCLVAIANHFNHDPYVGVPVAMGWGPNSSDNPTGWHSARAMFPWQGGTPMADPPMDQENTASIRVMFTHHAGFSSSVAFSDLGSPFFPCVTWKDGIWASAFTSGGAPGIGVLGSGTMLYTNDDDLIKNSDVFFGVGPFSCTGGEGGAERGSYYHFGDYRVAVKALPDCAQFIDPSWMAVPGSLGLYVDRYGEYHSTNDCAVVTGSFRQLAKLVYANEGTSYSQLPVGPTIEIGSPNDNQEFWEDAYEHASAIGEVPTGWTYGEEYPVAVGQACRCVTGIVVVEGDVSLAEIVSALCVRATMSPLEINVSELTERVIGFTVATQTNAADAINVLAPAFFFDGAEWDGVTHFVKRGHDHVEVLDFDDSVETDDPRIVETRAQEVELPATFVVSYFDPAADLAITTQRANRRAVTVKATGQDQLQIPVTMTTDQAAQVADILMKDKWSSLAGTIKQTVSEEFSYLTSTDVIHVQSDGAVFRVRLGPITTQDGTLAYEGTQDVQSAYTSDVEGLPPPTPVVGIDGPPSPTLALYFDLPALRDRDDQVGIYVAATGVAGNWPGALIEVSRDGGLNWTAAINVRQVSTVGQLLTDLGSWNPYIEDTEQTVDVRLTSGELSSITQTLLFQQGNAAVIGEEIVQFQTAVLIAPGQYRLSNMVRGRKNTEAVAHAENEDFAMLSDLYFLPLNRSDIGKALKFRAVTLGTANSEGIVTDFTYTEANSVIEWPVTHVRPARDAGTGDISIDWSPRHRLGNALDPYASLYFTGYQVVVSNGSSSKTYFVTDSAFLYTAAMQTSDFGGPVDPLSFTLSAVNSITGAGDAYSGTV